MQITDSFHAFNVAVAMFLGSAMVAGLVLMVIENLQASRAAAKAARRRIAEMVARYKAGKES